ncbi:MAG: MotA/TolQ/ExbB proton channel family protein [Gemmatimonadaceae bacterium]|nr:MotA/TolQ/ExbB proton channel family protein [Gemmatimonadaceae bacterium]MDQ3517880.1 MotA/TolQ/ExbB proton channel family protein [Gemmatimonadota bacterium]
MGSLVQWFRDGGWIMYPILAVAIVGLAIFLERLYTIVFRSKINGRAFIERIIQLVRAGKVEDAIKLCAQSNAVLPDMGLLILRSRSRDEADLQNVADAAALSVLPRLTRRLHYLPMLANVATLIGLLGTIFGLRAAFAGVSQAEAAERSAALAAGIAIALNATGFGLLVAVPLTVAHAYLVSQAETIIEQVDEFSVRLINALIDRPDVRLGHR